jgi:hypothetical protein
MKSIQKIIFVCGLPILHACTSNVICPTFDERYIMFAPKSDTTIYYNQNGDSAMLYLSLKKVASPDTFPVTCDCACSPELTMEFASDKIMPMESGIPLLLYKFSSSGSKNDMQVSYSIYYKSSLYYLDPQSFHFDVLLNRRMNITDCFIPLLNGVEVNGDIYNNVLKYDEKLYISKDEGVIMINDNGVIWTLNKWEEADTEIENKNS